jgi:hypothetical protein
VETLITMGGGDMAKFQGGLYPTVAVSDAFNCMAHAAAAVLAHNSAPLSPAAIWFAMVALAAFVGTLRFGFSESLFARANGDLANLCAYLALPLVGISFAMQAELISLGCGEQILFTALGACTAMAANSISDGTQELMKILLNLVMFVFPIVLCAWRSGDHELGAAVALFAVAGVAVGPDRHSFLIGVRRENWFHYMIGVASYGMARSLR